MQRFDEAYSDGAPRLITALVTNVPFDRGASATIFDSASGAVGNPIRQPARKIVRCLQPQKLDVTRKTRNSDLYRDRCRRYWRFFILLGSRDAHLTQEQEPEHENKVC
jgi:hypothetical protein